MSGSATRSRAMARTWTPAEILELAETEPDMGTYLTHQNGPGPEMVVVHDERLGEGPTSTEIRVLVPILRPSAVVVWFLDKLGALQGLDGVDVVMRKLAERTGSVFVLADVPVRSAAEAREQALRVLDWVHRKRADWVRPEAPLVLGGAGTGALLAAAAALAAERQPADSVALQVLVCPALDGGRAARVGERRAKRDLLDLGTVQRFWADWTAGADPSDAEGASPLQAGDLSGAPAALVLTAGRDPLAAGGRAFVERLKDAGVPVLDDDFPDDFHDFLNLLMMRSSETGFQRIIRAVRAVIVKGRL